MENAAQKVKDWWEVADRTQRFVTIFGASALILLLVLTGYVMSRPKMTPLYSGLTPEDQGKIVSALRKNGIAVELGARGSVLVPSNQASEAETLVASEGVSPANGPAGFDLLFENRAFGESSKQEQQRIIAAKEGELAKTIMTWQGVGSATVHWNPGDDSAFASEKEPSSATINIVESGSGLGGNAGKAIARLVQNATGVDPEQITVVNSFGRMLYDGQLLNDDGFGAGQKLAAEIQEARRRETDLMRTLDAAFGPGNTIAMVQVELDMDKQTVQEEVNTPSESPVQRESVTENLAATDAGGAGGITGFDSNNAGSAPTEGVPSGSEPGTYGMTHSNEIRALDRRVTQTSKAQGSVIGMTVQVLANKKNIEDVQAVQDIANAYLGSKKDQQGFSASVTAVDFDTKAIEEAKKAEGAAVNNARIQQLISVLPVVALFIVGFLVVRALGKAASKRVPTMAALPQGGAVPMSMGQQAVSPLPQGRPASSTPSFIQYDGMSDMPSPQGDAGQRLTAALGSGQIEDALKIIEEMPEDPEIKAIQARINVPLEQIKHMAKTKPQSVAMLLKGWMMEDMR